MPSATSTASGVIGCEVTRAAKGRSASLTAFMMAAGAAAAGEDDAGAAGAWEVAGRGGAASRAQAPIANNGIKASASLRMRRH